MHPVLVILEVLGLLMAALEFFGLSPKVQAWIDKYRRKYFDWLYLKGHEKILGSTLFVLLVNIPAFVLLPWLLYAAITKSAVAGILALTLLAVITIPFAFFAIVLPLVYNLLLTIDKSKGKTIGTVGFALAIGSSIAQRFASSQSCL
jgi:hypothetical protein